MRLDRLPRRVHRYRWPILLAVALVTAGAVPLLRQLRLQSGLYELFPRQPGPIADLALFGTLFGGSHDVVLLVRGDRRQQVARATRWVAARLGHSPHFAEARAGVEGLALLGALGRSLPLLADERAWQQMARRLSGPMAPQVARLRRLLLSPLSPGREAMTRDPLALSRLVLRSAEAEVDPRSGLYASADGKAALVFARPRADAAAEAVIRELSALQRRLGQTPGLAGVRLQLTGAPIYAHHFATTLRRDLMLSSTVALVGVILVLLIFFRSLRLLPLAAAVGGLAVVWTLGGAAALGAPLNMLSLAFAALCIGMGMDALIHIAVRAQEQQAQEQQVQAGPAPEPDLPAATRATHALFPALLAATCTTIAAFLAFSLSAFAGLSVTGLLAASGLALTFCLTLLLAPGFGPSPAAVKRDGTLQRALQRLGAASPLRSRLTALLALLSAAAALPLVGQLRFSDDLTGLAPEHFPPVRTDLAIARSFGRQRGRVVLLVCGPQREQVLQINDRLARQLGRLRQQGSVTSYRSLASLLPSRATQQQRRQRLRRLHPEQVVQRLRQALDRSGLRAEAFQPFFHSLTDPRPLTPERLPPGLRPLVQRQLQQTAQGWVAATLVHLPPAVQPATLTRLSALGRGETRVSVTGAALAGQQMAQLLRQDLGRISLLSAAAVLLLLALLLRAVWPVAAALLSLLWTGLTFAAVLSLCGQPIDLYNLMVLPVLIGYGVDDHIYVVRRALTDGPARAVAHSGRAVLVTTLTSMVAFGALLVCRMPGLRTLGSTAILGLGLGLIGSLVVMPALLALGPPHRRR